jgi:hypothetical protein
MSTDLACVEATDTEAELYTVHFFSKKWENAELLATQVQCVQ